MEAPSQNAQAEAKQLNIKLEKDGDDWIAILPPHPDLPGDDEVGFPATSEQEALDEARAYRSIEQSKVFKFEYDEKADQYVVSFADKTFFGKYLAPTYRDAQKAYAEFINKPEPPKAQESTPEPAKQRRKRTSNGGQPEREQITSGIGDKPTQLAPAPQTHEDMRKEARQIEDVRRALDVWDELDARITRLENVMRDALTATAKALEELRKR